MPVAPAVSSSPDQTDRANLIATAINSLPKYVVSNSPSEADATSRGEHPDHARLVTGDVVAAVQSMKDEPGDELQIWGSSNLLQRPCPRPPGFGRPSAFDGSDRGCETLPVNDDGLLAEQRAYYRARAPEYDEWWQRRGRYDRGSELDEEWDRQVAQVAAALDTFGATGDVLEMAGGTGWWTERLARTAGHLTVLDASPETLDLNRDRVRRPDVDYVVADLFSWRPQRTYDVVFFSFWLSHVPRSRFLAFWSLVRSCLAPGGRVFLIDNRIDPHPTGEIKDPYVVHYGPDLDLRRLHDGSKYQVVKVFYEPDELLSLLGDQGWTTEIEATRWFIFGNARLAERRQHDGPGASKNTW